jgi:tryptophanyl-tRNA synthetase
MRPTGKLHLGNLIGALQNWVELQKEHECFYFIADWHALTTEYADPKEINNNIREILLDWLAAGINPENSVVFLQSKILQHSELHLILSMITPLSWLERCPTYKEQLREMKERELTTYGFLGYPVLQAADILIYKADYVPVGEDQLPHLELTREIARRFNYLYKEIFPLPVAKLTQFPKLPGIDGKKMSKSYENCIYLSDIPEEIIKKVNLMFTDPLKIRISDPGHPEGCVVFSYHKIFSPENISEIEKLCKNGKLGCVEDKKNLSQKIISYLTGFWEKRENFKKNPEVLEEILEKGCETAKKIAEKTMEEVRKAVWNIS